MSHTCLFGSISSDPTLDPFALPLLAAPLKRWTQQRPATRHALGVGGLQQGRPVVRSKGGIDGALPNPVPHLLDTPGRARIGTLILDPPRVPPDQLPPYRAGGWVYAPWLSEARSPTDRLAVLDAIPDRLRSRHRTGSVSEASFLPLLDALERACAATGREQQRVSMIAALQSILPRLAATTGRADKGAVDPPGAGGSADVLVANGDVLIACCDLAPMAWKRHMGLTRAELTRTDPYALGISRDRPDYCVQLVVQGMGCPEGWDVLPVGSFVILSRDAAPFVGSWRA